MKSIFIILLVLISLIHAFKQDDDWKNYKKAHKKSYKDDADQEKHYKHFMKNDAKFKEHNRKFENKQVLYKMAHNRFSDKDEDEIKRFYLHKFAQSSPAAYNTTDESFPAGPPSISYRDFSLPVLNQGDCGSCWAFAAVAQVESQLKRKNSAFSTRISPQYLLDCVANSGCTEGGTTASAFAFIRDNGLVASTNYPYVAQKETCKNEAPKMTEKVSSVMHHSLNGNEEMLKNILAKVGPVVVSMHVEAGTFMHYDSGIYWDETCPNKCEKANHAMLLIGYGTDSNTYPFPVDYWVFKNSFGTSFGEGGYIRMIRNKDNLKNNCNVACGIDYST